MTTRKAQRGLTLIELTIAIATAGILAAAAAKGLEYAARSNSATNLAMQGTTNYDALQSYVATNVDALNTGAAVAGVAAPLAPTEAEMQALGYRTFSTVSTAGNGIVWNYTITRTPSPCTPETCNYLVYVGLSGAPRTRDNTIDIPLVGDAAQKSGRPAGFSTSGSPTVITGLGGAWTLANPVGNQAGILSFYGSYGAGQFSNYVRMGDTRAVTLNNTLAVGGAQTVGGTLAVTGNTTLNSALAVTGNTAVGGAVTAGGNITTGATVRGALVQSTGNVTAANAVTAGGTVQGGYVYSSGSMDAAGNASANYVTARAGLRSWSTGDWGVILGDSSGNLNANAQSHVGSMHVNDIYIRSRGRWASQGSAGGACYWTGTYNLWAGGAGFCNDGYYMRGWHGPYYHADTNVAQFLCCQL